MAASQSSPENPRALTRWEPVQKGLAALILTPKPTPADLANPFTKQNALRQMVVYQANQETLRRLKEEPQKLSLKIVVDGTGSMSDDEGAVRSKIIPFIFRTFLASFGDMPPELVEQINQQMQINVTRIDFGDPAYIWGNDDPGTFSGQTQEKEPVDNPFLSVEQKEFTIQRKTTEQEWETLKDWFSKYAPHFKGGGNSGEGATSALLAALGLIKENTSQTQLLQRLLTVCERYLGRGRTKSIEERPIDSDVQFLKNLMAGSIPHLLNNILKSGTENGNGDGNKQVTTTDDIVIFITDEPSKDVVIKLQELIDLRIRPRYLAVITPDELENRDNRPGNHWKEDAVKLGGKWFDLNKLDTETDHIDTSGFSTSLQNVVGDIQIEQILLQLTPGKTS